MSDDAGHPSPSVWDRLAAIPDLEDEPRPAPPDPEAAVTPDTPTPPAAADARTIIVAPTTTTPHDAAVPEPQPAPGLPPTAPSRRRRRRRRWPLVLVLTVAAVTIGFAVYALVAWNRIDRIDTAGALSPGGDPFTNYLVVGTDSRETFDPDDPAATDVGLGFVGSRADSMILLHVGPGGNHIVSFPRDLRVTIPGHGQSKINAAHALGGAPLVIETVRTQFDVPVHRYLEVDLAGFMDVVDTVGGVTVTFPRAACDVKSGLFVTETGDVELDGRAALAYVRSRSYTEFDAAAAAGLTTCAQVQAAGLGSPGGSDLDRTERQREVLLTTLADAAGSRNPVTLLRVLGGLSGGLRIDDEMGLGDAIGLAQEARSLNARNHGLPVADQGADLVTTGEAEAVLDLFRS